MARKRERERGERGKRREGRIKTNPLCELVLVAMATIITSHLGEQEQGERRGGGEREEGKKKKERERRDRGRGMKTWRQEEGGGEKKNEKMKCQIPGTVQKCQGEESRGGL